MPAGPEALWRIGGKTLTELKLSAETFESEGTFKIEVPKFNTTFDCSELGTGTISSSGAVVANMTLSCKLVGAENCVIDPIEMEVDGKFSSLYEKLFKIVGDSECGFWHEQFSITNGSGSFDFGSEAKAMNLTASHATNYGEHAVSVTGSSFWELSGINKGKTLGIW